MTASLLRDPQFGSPTRLVGSAVVLAESVRNEAMAWQSFKAGGVERILPGVGTPQPVD
jgi:hypothetical protein